MKIPSDIKYIRKVSTEIENFLKSKNVDKSEIFDIRLCVEEAVKNAIIHGNKNKKDLPVFISYSLEDGRFAIEIEDKGKGFDPGKVPDPTKEENLLTEGGRGVFIIRKMMDKVRYDNSSRGNKVFMVKFIGDKKGRH
ncbi:MAG: ATP-binding protein [Candidatus Omnitrophica bacterium]|nr:ATP-binding protein [Candidatus Omnitrophota bacterium]